jgi:chaperonin GroEL (HSP60 family)
VLDGKVKNMEKAGVFEPLAVKKQIIKSATEAATMLLKIDDVIAAGKTRAPPMPPKGPPGMGGMGGMGPEGAGEF